MRDVGIIKAIYRYPVKSMACEQLTSAELGWHGIDGDRRYAFARTGNMSGFPWLTASKMPQLIRYKPYYGTSERSSGGTLRVITPDGTDIELESAALREQLSATFGSDVGLLKVDNGIFDDSPLSLLSTETIKKIETESGRSIDARRFRPNILIEPLDGASLQEDNWVGRTLILGKAPDAPAVRVTIHDVRCVMVNLDPDTATADPLVLRTVARTRNNCAGVYGTTFRTGTITIGDHVCTEEI